MKKIANYVKMTYYEKVINTVYTSRRARKSLLKLPKVIAAAYVTWELSIRELGLHEVQKISGYHDEQLSGKLKGIRSFRLSKDYRGYYRIINETIAFVMVEEVNKHDYKKVERLFGG